MRVPPLSLFLVWPVLAGLTFGLPIRAAERAVYDSNGRIVGLVSPGEDLAVASSVVAVLPSGKKIPLQVRSPSAGAVRDGDALSWSAPFALPDGSRGRVRIRGVEDNSSVSYSVAVTAETNLDVEAVDLVLDLPRPDFLEGQVMVSRDQAGAIEPIALRKTTPRDSAFFRGAATAFHVQDATAARSLDISFDHARDVALLDRWDTAGRSFQVRIPLRRGPWAAGDQEEVAPVLRLTEKPAPAPVAHLRIDPAQARYAFQGFGGNYCWDNRSPVAAYTLEHLKIAWARTAMKLVDWDRRRERDKLAGAPQSNDPGPELRADFEVMQRLQKMGVPFVISIWTLPERFYTDPNEKPPTASFRSIDPDKWDELTNLIGDYLLFAKRMYSVEPDLFSFNEANIGINIGQSPEAHARAIARLGAYFQKIGLKTKLLLGDTGGPRDTHTFALAAASDPAAREFIGAVAFHSWGGASAEQYSTWGDLAEWLNLPLLVTEVGVDPSAYFTHAWDSFDYGLREARMMQQLLTSARPQALLFWQYTDDYGLARVLPGGGVEPSARFWLMKQFTDLTPQPSDALAAVSDQANVLVTAFRGGQDYTLHVLNLGAARAVELSGVPDMEWQVTATTEEAPYSSKPAIRSSAHSAMLNLPGRALVTLRGHAP